MKHALNLIFVLLLSSSIQAQLPNIDYAAMFFQTVSPSVIRKISALPATCTAVGAAGSSNAVLYQGRVYQCVATNTWGFAAGQSAALTSTRVPYANANGILTDNAAFTFTAGTGQLRATTFKASNGATFLDFQSNDAAINDSAGNLIWRGLVGGTGWAGKATLSSGTVTVSTTCAGTLGADTIIQLTPKGSSTGVVRVSATTANTSFTITSSDAASADDVYWTIFKIN